MLLRRKDCFPTKLMRTCSVKRKRKPDSYISTRLVFNKEQLSCCLRSRFESCNGISVIIHWRFCHEDWFFPEKVCFFLVMMISFLRRDTKFLLQQHKLSLLTRAHFSISVWSMTFSRDVCFLTPIASVFFFGFPTELYHCVHLRYYKTVLRFVLSNPSWRQPPWGGTPVYDSIPHRGIPLSHRG